jgi:putative hydrolase of the HAD superfamily
MIVFHLGKKIKLVCFDLDNTIYDYSSAESETEAYIADNLGRIIHKKIKQVKSKDILTEFNSVKISHMHHDSEPTKFSRGLWWKETLSNLNIIATEDNLNIIEKTYWNYLTDKIKLYPGIPEVLEKLKSKGILVASITDSDGSKDINIYRIKKLGLEKYIDVIITPDDTGKNKPAIENWKYLLKSTNLKAGQCIMVGDHPEVDLINAKKLGLTTVWTKQHINTDLHYNYVDYEIIDIRELMDINLIKEIMQ